MNRDLGKLSVDERRDIEGTARARGGLSILDSTAGREQVVEIFAEGVRDACHRRKDSLVDAVGPLRRLSDTADSAVRES